MLDKKAKYEKRLVREFLEFTSTKYRRLKALSEYCPGHKRLQVAGPDLKAHIETASSWLPIGIEVTAYQVDRGRKGSAARQRCDFWRHLNGILRRNHLWRFPCFKSVTSHLGLNGRVRFKKSDAKCLAGELVRFVIQNAPQNPGRVSIRKGRSRSRQGVFHLYPEIDRHIEYIEINRYAWENPIPLQWSRADVASVNAVPPILIKILGEKGARLKNYDVHDVKRSWLLICATGQTSHDRAGPPRVRVELAQNRDVKKAAQASGFDRVIFWERAGRWSLVL